MRGRPASGRTTHPIARATQPSRCPCSARRRHRRAVSQTTPKATTKIAIDVAIRIGPMMPDPSAMGGVEGRVCELRTRVR